MIAIFQLLIDQWTSLARSSLSSGTIGLEANPKYYEVSIDYKAPTSNSALSLDFVSDGRNRTSVPSSNLYLPIYLSTREVTSLISQSLIPSCCCRVSFSKIAIFLNVDCK